MLTVEQAEELKASVDQRAANADTLIALIELLTDTVEPEADNEQRLSRRWLRSSDVPDVE